MNWKACIIIPVYNMNPVLLRASIMSAMRQTFPVDVLIFDDHSTDERMLQMVYNILKHEGKREARVGKHRRAFRFLRDDAYTKEQFPTAGRIFNAAKQYVREQGYEKYCIMGGDDIALPNFAAVCLGYFFRSQHSKLAGVDCRCMVQLGADSKFRLPFTSGTIGGNITYGSSPQWWDVKLMDGYRYPEDKDHPMTDWYIYDWVQAQGYVTESIEPMEYVYVFHEGQISRATHLDRSVQDFEALRDHLSGKRFIPEVDKLMDYLIMRGGKPDVSQHARDTTGV